MKKFFLFRRESESAGSGSTTSNTGVGISSLSIPADSMAYMTTKVGGLVITFNQSSAFESSFLNPGESIPKTSVEVGCAKGEETALMESILNFISSESKKSIMRFDAVNQNSTFSQFVQEKESVSPVIPTLAVETVSGEISQGTQEQQFQNTIASINFQGNLPIVDYNHLGLASFSGGATITSWSNSGTGGSTYNLTPTSTDTPSAAKAASQLNFSTDAVNFALNESFDVPALTIQNDYTIYVVIGTANTVGVAPMYGDSSGECIGFSGVFMKNGASAAPAISNKTFSVRHKGRTGAVASVKTSVDTIDNNFNSTVHNGCHVFVIRRDENFNMMLHAANRTEKTGDIIGVIDAVTGKSNTSGATDGNLLIERLGHVGGAFKGDIPRFGIIEKDIGANAASTLATDLFNLYTL